MTRSYARKLPGSTTAVLAAAALLLLSSPARAQGSDPKAVLKAMSLYVSSQKTIELTFDSDIEVITPQLEKIQFTSSGEMLLSRPDKMRAHRMSGHADVSLFFDGKTASVFGKSHDNWAQFEAAGNVDQLVAALRAGHGVSMPGADLLLSNPYEVLVADVEEAKYIGRGVVEGVLCEHLAFRNFDTDWQLWVETGATPVPRKMVITSKTVSGAPQYTVRVKTRRVVVASAATTSAATTSAATASAASANAAAQSAQASAAQAQAQAAQAAAARPAGAPPVGSVVQALPSGCVSAPKGGVEYQNCGGVYYRAAFQGNNLVYVVEAP